MTCSVTSGRFQIIKTEYYASHISYLTAFFCFDYQDDRALNCKQYSGWWSPTRQSLVQDVKDTKLLSRISTSVPSHFTKKDHTPPKKYQCVYFILFHTDWKFSKILSAYRVGSTYPEMCCMHQRKASNCEVH